MEATCLGERCSRALRRTWGITKHVSWKTTILSLVYIVAAILWGVFAQRASSAARHILTVLGAEDSRHSLKLLWVQQDAVVIISSALFGIVGASLVFSNLLQAWRKAAAVPATSSPGHTKGSGHTRLRLFLTKLQVFMLYACCLWGVLLLAFSSTWAAAAVWLRETGRDAMRAESGGLKDSLILAYNVTGFLKQYRTSIRPKLTAADATLLDDSLSSFFSSGTDMSMVGLASECPANCLSLQFVHGVVGGLECICKVQSIAIIQGQSNDMLQALKPALVALLVLFLTGGLLLVHLGAEHHRAQLLAEDKATFMVYKNAVGQEESSWWQDAVQEATGCWRRKAAPSRKPASRSRAQGQEQMQQADGVVLASHGAGEPLDAAETV